MVSQLGERGRSLVVVGILLPESLEWTVDFHVYSAILSRQFLKFSAPIHIFDENAQPVAYNEV